MSNRNKPRRAWIGNSLIAIATLHGLAAGLLFGPALMDILRSGIFNAINPYPLRQAAIWFLLFAGPLALLGLCVNQLEKQDEFPLAKPIGWGILLLCLCGVTLMPFSGFWLAIPPALALLTWQAKSITVGVAS